MSEGLLKRVKEARTSGAVLKVRLSNIRARHPTSAILVFEGDEDVGPYNAWISRIDDNLVYDSLPGKGKGQLLDLRRRLRSDTNSLSVGVFFFVDRDYDDLRGHPPGDDIYSTESYSIENDLVCEQTFIKILSDEFRCTAETEDRKSAVAMFRTVGAQFASVMECANRRIFRARKLKINVSIVDSISKYADISLEEVKQRYTDYSIESLIKLEREPTPEECALVDHAFSALDPFTRHRGKFWIAFFLRWLEELATERRDGARGLFSSLADIGFSASSLPLASLAIKSRLPNGLRAFIAQINGSSITAVSWPGHA